MSDEPVDWEQLYAARWRYEGDRFSLVLPRSVTGQQSSHDHDDIDTMHGFRGWLRDGVGAEVVISVKPRSLSPLKQLRRLVDVEYAVGRLVEGKAEVAGARRANRWEGVMQLDTDPDVAPEWVSVTVAEAPDRRFVVLTVLLSINAVDGDADEIVGSLMLHP